MEKRDTARVITLGDVWKIFVRNIIPIVLAAVIVVALVFVYGTIVLTPKYSSTSTLYILKQENSNDYVYTQSDFTLALNVVNDCTYMVKSHEVLDSVINKLDLDMSYKSLYNDITINNPDNTRILEVTVETVNAELSKQIVDEVCCTAADNINKAMGVDQVNVYSKGTIGANPSNSIGMTTFVLTAIATAIVVYIIYFIAFVVDDKIKTEEDVEKYLGLSVLGDIPNSNASKRKDGKYGYYYNDSSIKKQSANQNKGGKAK